MSGSHAYIPATARSRRASSAWSSADIRLLRELAAQNVPLEAIATALRRSPSAVKNKAGMHGISLRRAGSATMRQCG